jgi:hypothetical protein
VQYLEATGPGAVRKVDQSGAFARARTSASSRLERRPQTIPCQ